MDTSETYIKMCEKAWPFLKGKHGYSYIAEENEDGGYSVTTLPDFDTDKYRPLGWVVFTQDQLQEMVKDNSVGGLIQDFSEFARTTYFHYPADYEFPSMEQLWLAFVLAEKYNKVWDGEDWVKE